MKKISLLMVACLFLACWVITGHCQDDGGSDSAMESGIEQSESAAGQNLDSEIASDRAQSESEVSQMEGSMATTND